MIYEISMVHGLYGGLFNASYDGLYDGLILI